ncbi:uncharacterized protein STEHIDRAFT_155121 [Stereum hirsutum FP-91666 SS1]|uniref:uncharacterized protein n=1 Tax=Stereum hirsutum (strain FP-91666) TaxID=721885 RepID=UPI000440B5F3|nr:uncharacterized protein STEHIDRAFT_155121 [Stereum hirsutum FP-91666 SS1]EIM87747.1 hypothetical protein STEHIDRAFT_155121 [Stereum hirsutum FP-91666 SS1]
MSPVRADTISKRSKLQIDIWILNDEVLERGIAKLKINGDYDRLGEGDYEVSSDNADDRSLDGGVSALAIECNDTDTLVTASTHGHYMDKGVDTNGDKGSGLLDEPETSRISHSMNPTHGHSSPIHPNPSPHPSAACNNLEWRHTTVSERITNERRGWCRMGRRLNFEATGPARRPLLRLPSAHALAFARFARFNSTIITSHCAVNLLGMLFPAAHSSSVKMQMADW